MDKNKMISSISSVCDVVLSGTPQTSKPDYWDGGINWITVKDIVACNGRFIENTEKQISKKGVEHSAAKLFPKWTIVISARGTVGKVGIMSKPMSCNQSCYALIAKTDVIRPLFLYYVMKITSLTELVHGSVFDTIITTTFDHMKFELHPLFEQDKILKHLNTLDEKLELLEKQNQTLEKIIQAIFKSWFVDFDGQTESVDSELGQIPHEWVIETLGNILSLLKDGSHNPPQRVENGIKFITGGTLDFIINYDSATCITREDYEKIQKYYQLNKDDVFLSIVGTLGNIAIVRESDLPLSHQRSAAVLRPNNLVTTTFLFCLLKSKTFQLFLDTHQTRTAQPSIFLGTLSSFQFVLPPLKNIQKFDNIALPIIRLIQTNYDQMRILTKTRDSLLPKLMSGEIRAS